MSASLWSFWPRADQGTVISYNRLLTLLDLGVSSLRRGHANLLCIVPGLVEAVVVVVVVVLVEVVEAVVVVVVVLLLLLSLLFVYLFSCLISLFASSRPVLPPAATRRWRAAFSIQHNK